MRLPINEDQRTRNFLPFSRGSNQCKVYDIETCSIFFGSSMARCVMEVVRQVVTVPLLQVLRQFGHMAARYRICVGAEVLLPSITRLASLSTVTW